VRQNQSKYDPTTNRLSLYDIIIIIMVIPDHHIISYPIDSNVDHLSTCALLHVHFATAADIDLLWIILQSVTQYGSIQCFKN